MKTGLLKGVWGVLAEILFAGGIIAVGFVISLLGGW
jgi:hypothetical protein